MPLSYALVYIPHNYKDDFKIFVAKSKFVPVGRIRNEQACHIKLALETQKAQHPLPKATGDPRFVVMDFARSTTPVTFFFLMEYLRLLVCMNRCLRKYCVGGLCTNNSVNNALTVNVL